MKPRPSIVAAVICAMIGALVAGGGSARAEAAGAGNGFAKRLFAGDPGKQEKSYACFVCQYDAAHLARHPLQKVNAMKLLITAERVPEDEALNYSFRLGLTFRNRPGNFDSSGDCGHLKETSSPDNKAQLGCSVDCEGGGITVELAGDSKSTKIRLDTIRIWRNNKPDEDGFSISGARTTACSGSIARASSNAGRWWPIGRHSPPCGASEGPAPSPHRWRSRCTDATSSWALSQRRAR